jgi:predicted dehydrogenase
MPLSSAAAVSPSPADLRLSAPRRVAIIGAGAMARAHIDAFRSLPGVEVAGVHSRTRAKAETLAAECGVPGVYDDVAALYAGTKADLVVSTVSTESSLETALACLRHPWGVLLEKPPGCDANETRRIAAAASAADARVWTAFNRRHYAATLAVDADLSTDPGRRYIRVQDRQSIDEALAWGYPEKVARRFMYANSSHLIDYFTLFGRGHVTAVTPVEAWRPDEPGVVLAKIDFSSGDVGLYEGLWRGPGPWSCVVSTARRRWELRPLETARRQNINEREQIELPPDPDDLGWKPGLRRQAAAALLALEGRASAPLADLDAALRTMCLIEQIFTPAT